MTESFINALSQLPDMKVIARSSVFRYKGKETDVQQAAKDLNVRAVLTGRVLQRGDTLDVSIELTDAQNNTQLWGQHFTRKAADIFAVQDEIAEQATSALRLRLTGAQAERVVKRYTDDEAAYKLYLQGRFYFNKRTNDGARKAVDYFKQATARDPAYALADAGLADADDEVAGTPGAPLTEVYPQGRAAVMQALAIDNNLAEAHEALGNIKLDYDWDFVGAESEYKEALALNPNDALDVAGVYAALGDRDHVFEWLEKGIQQHDPSMTGLRVFPPLEPLHSDPRFQDLLRRVGLPQ